MAQPEANRSRCEKRMCGRRWALVAVAAVVGVLSIGVGASIVAARRSARAESPAPAASQKGKYSLVYNVNNAGYIDVCGCKRKEVRQGSLTRRSSFLKQLRSTGRELLLVDAGSAFFPINETVKPAEVKNAVGKAKVIAEAYNRMGYQALAVGPYDLVTGLDNLREIEKVARFPFLSANFFGPDGKLLFKPSIVVEVAGLKVGLFGLTLDTVPKRLMEQYAPGCTIGDPMEAALRTVAELRGKCDQIVALSHLREDSNFALIKKLTDLEILIDPYILQGSHKVWLKEESEWLDVREGTLFLRSDGQGARLGVVDIELKKPGMQLADGGRVDELAELVEYDEATPEEKSELEKLSAENLFRFTRVSLEPHHLSDPDIDQLVDAWKKGIDPAEAKRLEVALPKRNEFATVGKCKTCHEKQFNWWKDTPHAHAMASLEKTGDHQRFDCIGCHSLGYGQAWLDTTSPGEFGNVQCESCHGTNTAHLEAPEENSFRRVRKNDCLVCHNEEQTLEPFNYASVRRKMTCPKGS